MQHEHPASLSLAVQDQQLKMVMAETVDINRSNLKVCDPPAVLCPCIFWGVAAIQGPAGNNCTAERALAQCYEFGLKRFPHTPCMRSFPSPVPASIRAPLHCLLQGVPQIAWSCLCIEGCGHMSGTRPSPLGGFTVAGAGPCICGAVSGKAIAAAAGHDDGAVSAVW